MRVIPVARSSGRRRENTRDAAMKPRTNFGNLTQISEILGRSPGAPLSEPFVEFFFHTADQTARRKETP
jgi:hypothetical protein